MTSNQSLKVNYVLIGNHMITVLNIHFSVRKYLCLFLSASITILNGCDNERATYFLAVPRPILFISNESGTNQLYSMKEDGSDIQQLTADSDFPIDDARWSPDGKKIVVESWVGGVDFYGPALYIMDAGGGGRRKLTVQNGRDINYATGWTPRWSPNSKKIAFYRVMVPEGFAGSDIFVIDPDGHNEQQITDTPSEHEGVGDWSPDGQSLLISFWGARFEKASVTAIISLEGVCEEILSDTNALSGGPIYGSNDRVIYYQLDTITKKNELILMDLLTKERNPISTTNHSHKGAVDWYSSGDLILINAVNGFDETSEGIFIKNIMTGELIDITPFKDRSGVSFATSWLSSNHY